MIPLFCQAPHRNDLDIAAAEVSQTATIGSGVMKRMVAKRPLGILSSCLVPLAMLLLGPGCRAPLKSVDVAREAFFAGDLAASETAYQKVIDSSSRLSDPSELDLAVVELAGGDPGAAEARLRKLRDRFDALPASAPLHDAASMISDDTVRAYRPAGYEEVMIRALLAVCSLANDAADAEAYCLQASMKQSELAEAASQRLGDRGRGDRGQGDENLGEGADLDLDIDALYQPIALAPYMRGMLREANHQDYDDAARAYQLVSAARPSFAPIGEDIERASGGTHSAPGNGVLYVIACVGKGPQRVEIVAETTTASLQIASTVLSASTNQSDEGGNAPVLPNIASVKVPAIAVPYIDVAALGIRVDGQLFGATQTLTDVAELAQNQVHAEMPWTIARAVARRVTKEATVAGAAGAMGLEGTAANLFQFAAASAWSGTEQADTRCWGLLPREIQVLRAELPAGEHKIDIEPLDTIGRPIGSAQPVLTQISDGINRYIIVIAPGATMYVVES